MKDKKDRLEITELFMAKADWSRTFIGTIERYTNEDGSELVIGKIPVHEYTIIASSYDDIILGRKLDEIVTLLLDYNLHNNEGVKHETNTICIFLN